MNNDKRMTIPAGGGLVENEKGEILFMFRRNKWDLPKGKLDPEETLPECALREVREETGLIQLELMEFLLITNHAYEEHGRLFMKESHWFRMKAASHQALIPQTAEDITELKWFATADFKLVLQNTYPAIIEVLQAGGFPVTV